MGEIRRIEHTAEANEPGMLYLLPSGAIAEWTGNKFRHVGWLADLTSTTILRQRSGDHDAD